VNDATHASGRFGIGHHEYFGNDDNVRGTHAENFHASCVDFDYDDDGDVDVNDVFIFLWCFQGPDAAYAPGHFCVGEDSDGDLDVDLADFSVLQTHFTGPQ